MEIHGNSNNNEKKHHLYVIYDEEVNDVFKYGISDKIIEEDGYSKRMREQVDYLNRAVGWNRYRAEVLQNGIEGKVNARLVEDEQILAYINEFGRSPRGNVRTPRPF